MGRGEIEARIVHQSAKFLPCKKLMWRKNLVHDKNVVHDKNSFTHEEERLKTAISY